MINTHLNLKGKLNCNKHKDGLIYIPLQFWFNRNPGLSLPIIALQYQEVEIKILIEDI